MRYLPTTVRMKLALTAAAGLVLMGLMTAMVMNTSSAAFDVVTRTRADHERMRAFTQLHGAGEILQRRAYGAAQEEGQLQLVALDALAEARLDFQRRLARAQQMAPNNEYGHRLVAELQVQGEEVLELFQHGPELLQAIDVARKDGGTKSAVAEMMRLSAPYLRFLRTVEGEIQRSDSEVSAATARSVSLQDSMRTAALLGLALGITGTAIIFGLLMLRLGPALHRLEQGTRAFGAGQLEHRVHVNGRDELAQLGNAFNAMAGELADKQQALEESRAGLGRAVATRTAELKEANAALSAEDERRSRFLAEASHELRIPVTIIRG